MTKQSSLTKPLSDQIEEAAKSLISLSMADNMALWKTVFRTDPNQVKPITGKPYKGSSPKPYWIIQQATEKFGPCGIGWGFTILNERVEPGADGDKLHIAHIRVWYIWNEKRGEVEHVGQTMFSGHRKADGNKPGLPYTDEDAPKKSVTDALVKALSMIGFAGDIFMGRYDDSKYVNEITREIAQEKRDEIEQAAMPDRQVAEDHLPQESGDDFPGDTPAIPESISHYIGAFKDKLAACSTRTLCAGLWKAEKQAREFVGIPEGSHVWSELHTLWSAKGKELAAASIVNNGDAT